MPSNVVTAKDINAVWQN